MNDAVIHGQNRRAARRKDIGRLMRFPAGAALTKSVLNIAGANSANRQGEVPPQESLVIVSEEVRPGRQNRILEWFPGLALAAARVRKVETQISDTQNQRQVSASTNKLLLEDCGRTLSDNLRQLGCVPVGEANAPVRLSVSD